MPSDAAQLETNNQSFAPKPTGKVRLLTLADLDKRTTAAKRARDLIRKVHGDLGGTEHLATGEKQVVQLQCCWALWRRTSRADGSSARPSIPPSLRR